MALRIDSKLVIMAMIEDPNTFPTMVAALDKDVAKHLVAHFKDKGMGLDRLRATHVALGGDSLALAFEGLDDKTVAALLKKADPHRISSGSGTDVERLKDLASGTVEPEPKPEKPRKALAPKPKPPALKRAGADKAASAKGTGTRPTGATSTSEVGEPPKRSRSTKKAPTGDQ